MIYCDGDYWHNFPDRIIDDKNKTQDLIRNGYKVVRLKEKDIKNNAQETLRQNLIRSLSNDEKLFRGFKTKEAVYEFVR